MNGKDITVKELIDFLETCDKSAIVTVGDNFYNGISISCGYSEGCKYDKCEFICFDTFDSCYKIENES